MDSSVELLEVGTSGKVELVPGRTERQQHVPLPHKTLPFGIPPVFQSLEEELERKYLDTPEDVVIHNFKKNVKFWGREICKESLYHVDICPGETSLDVERNKKTGELTGLKEVVHNVDSSSKNSFSLRRQPGPVMEDVRGSSINFPFWPGGLDELELEAMQKVDSDKVELNFETDLLAVPPGFTNGMNFDVKNDVIGKEKKQEDANDNASVPLIFLENIMAADFVLNDEDEKEVTNATEAKVDMEKAQTDIVSSEQNELKKSDSLEKLVMDEKPVVNISTTVTAKPTNTEEWAVVVDVNKPVDNFKQAVPAPAKEWPFELDIFQKQAILHLENHDSVFVAAHTSAGKTVIAEYAIALSLRHLTRTIYTSPIKALSNQKYRDFKQTFVDVGLVTGDVQINQTASCLIMTTEILRSMLYNGSDVIRDLEWVVFDEVHYINDSERGVVWEEVLIMLPQHVNIILLSATVPNTAEFADWVGKIKKKKIYVISTVKRPVPLEHYLYTGNSNKTNNELFNIVDAAGKFLTSGHTKAVEAKNARASKSSQSFGPKGHRGGNPAQDKNVWLSVIDMLRKREKLPMVAFIFSKSKIEANVENLGSVDLTTAKEKSEIHRFYRQCISRLKGTDKSLPQVLQMEDVLKRGLGVHHSGILPMLKEIVELLFQKGLVKILFATETFAMGVNMPARSVLFGTIRKHDGTGFRDLKPGEYIQMAGRAGRRGLDTTGTVIIMCTGDVPELADLHSMILGKPTKLESQFRLTYTMILNLLKVIGLRVEDMMKRSFSESQSQKNVKKVMEDLEKLRVEISEIKDIECYVCNEDLEKYYETCSAYRSLKKQLQELVLSHPVAIKSLSAGRVVVIDSDKSENHLGIILQNSLSSKNERIFTALCLCDKNESAVHKVQQTSMKNELIISPVTGQTHLFVPEGQVCHEVVNLSAKDISVITTKTIKVECDKIISDVKKRQQFRFKDDPPGKSVSIAAQELLRLTEANVHGLPGLDPVKDLNLRDIEMVEKFKSLGFIESKLLKHQCIQCSKFTEHFSQFAQNMNIKEKYRSLKFMLSDESLSLLPEYQQRLEVLRSLDYIDSANAVQLKGRVACTISNHELMITEMIFENVLSDLHPTEIAAILSCFVFEQKRCSEPKLIDTLQNGKKRVLEIAEKIGIVQRENGMEIPVEQFKETFHFGLMEVVFEWTRGLPFSKIIELTDVQEGIIVRCIQRLNETLRDVRNAARLIGDPVLFQKMDETSNLIKRDIVFAASLYL